jgi:hypothetical protein
MTIEELVDAVPGFASWTHADRIRLFAWFLHRHESKPRFQPADVRRLYGALSLAEPANYTRMLESLRESKSLLRDAGGLHLEKRLRDEFDAKYAERPTRIAVHELLATLPERVPNIAERVFLEEALKCFAAGAFRAAVVMAWNLGFDHLCKYVLSSRERLDAFNRQWPLVLAKHHRDARVTAVSAPEHFAEFKESQVLVVCRSAAIISGDIEKVLSQKLERRNSAAHPSGVAIEQLQAEEYIDDLVKNVVLKLA